jgi:SAM-dependent methyltransferase
MSGAQDAESFRVSGEAYDRFMGRYSAPLAVASVDALGLEPGSSVLDVGCGPGALTGELARRLGPAAVHAVDPSESFVAACRNRNPGVDVRLGRAEELPFPDSELDAALAQLVLHFVTNPEAAAAEMRRVVRPGGLVAASVWDFGEGMTMLSAFWGAARSLDPDAPAESETRRFGRDGAIAELFAGAGLDEVAKGALEVSADYESFDDFWAPFSGGVGPAGAYVVSLDAGRQDRLRDVLRDRLGSPDGPFTLPARAWFATGRAPGRK